MLFYIMFNLYLIFIQPIEKLMNLILDWSYSLTSSYGVSIIILSIALNIVILPLYYLAEVWRDKNLKIIEKMKPEIDNIKKSYKGQEKHYYIQTVYRRYNYTPFSSIKASFGFLIQIPLFVAAFHFLSHYEQFNGASFLFIQDLGKPDSLFGGINLLPFIMTIVNLISAYIYMNKMSKIEKVQLISMAFIFLLLLYNEPSSLLLYWTMNNIFSLVKNFIEKTLNIGTVFNKYFKINISFRKIRYIDILLTLLLGLFYFFIITQIADNGINNLFAQRSILYIYNILAFSLALFLFILAFKSSNIRYLKINKYMIESNNKSDFIILLLPMTPIVQYVILNQNILSIYSTFYMLSFFLIVSLIVVISIPILLSKYIAKEMTLSLSVSLLFLTFYMPILSFSNSWHESGNIVIQLFILSIMIILISYLYRKNIKLLYIIVIILFLLNSFNAIFSLDTDTLKLNKKQDNSVVNSLTELPDIDKVDKNNLPDIYLLVYDAYVGQETMLKYGIDNSKQESFLKNNNFKIYSDAYSLGAVTVDTMWRVLEMSQERGDLSRVISGNSNIHQALHKFKYYQGGVFEHGGWWKNTKPILDFYYPRKPDNGHSVIIKSILYGEFLFDANLKFSKSSIDLIYFMQEKRKFMQLDKHPKFLYTHTGPGHSQNSGKCLINEIDLYKKRLNRANIEMKDDIATILKNNPNSIIVVMGDHGPYLTENCYNLEGYKQTKDITRLDIQDRFGTFLAIRWPKSIDKVYDKKLLVVQNIFPSILATILKDKSILSKFSVPTKTITNKIISGVYVENGIIHGGVNNNEKLFKTSNKGSKIKCKQ